MLFRAAGFSVNVTYAFESIQYCKCVAKIMPKSCVTFPIVVPQWKMWKNLEWPTSQLVIIREISTGLLELVMAVVM